METKIPQIPSKDLSRSLGFLVHDVARLMRRAFDRKVKHLGLTRAQWFVLVRSFEWRVEEIHIPGTDLAFINLGVNRAG